MRRRPLHHHMPSRGKRNKMRRFNLEEISIVDKPAQEGATARIIKRQGGDSMVIPGRPEYNLRKARFGRITTSADDPFISMAPRQASRRSAMRVSAAQHRANINEEIAAMQARAASVGERITKQEALRRLRKADPAVFEELEQADDLEQFKADPEEEETDKRRFVRGPDGSYIEDDEEEDEDDFEMDADEENDFEMDEDEERVRELLSDKNAALDEDEVDAALEAESLKDDVEDEEEKGDKEDPSTEVGVLARRYRARGIGKHTALTKASRDLAFQGGFYKHFAKGGASAGASSTPSFGREREQQRRLINKAVAEERAEDPMVSHTVAMQRARKRYPSIFR